MWQKYKITEPPQKELFLFKNCKLFFTKWLTVFNTLDTAINLATSGSGGGGGGGSGGMCISETAEVNVKTTNQKGWTLASHVGPSTTATF